MTENTIGVRLRLVRGTSRLKRETGRPDTDHGAEQRADQGAAAASEFSLDVNLAVPASGITVLFGASGAGKTTLLRCVAGLERADDALITVGGAIWDDSACGIHLPTWHRSIGYVFQEASLFPHLSVTGNLRYGLKRAGPAQGEASLRTAIELLGIGHLLHRMPAQLSGGERQRVAIARSLALRPRLLLLDEPLAAIDLARRAEILPWIEALRDQLSIPMLYVTHAAAEVARLADTLVVLERGRARACGPVGDVLASVEVPISLGEDVGALIEGIVAERDELWHLIAVDCAQGRLWLQDSQLGLGDRVRLRVLARDVSITLQHATDTSIQNHLQCVVESINPDKHPAQALISLLCGDSTLLARLTQRAIAALGLHPGQAVWAQVKSVALVK